jgi:UMF1 family MFS transporter
LGIAGSFLPVTLEQLAREVGVLRKDGVTPCTSAAAAAARLGRRDDPADTQCVIRLLGTEINTSSFALYTFSAAVFVQALTVVSISAIADHGRLYFMSIPEISICNRYISD